MSARPSVLSVLRNRDFRLLWTADMISDAGSFITFIALAVYVHQLTGKALAVGVALALRAIPWFTLGPVAGVIADRVDRRVIMVTCDVARAALVALLPFTDTAGQAYAISFASGLFGPVFRPARQALIPTLVGRQDYVRALALGEVSHQVLHTVGPALGGLAVLAVGARNAFFLDAVTFLVSALFVLGVRPRGVLRGRPAGMSDVWRDLREGARILWGDRVLRSIVAVRAAIILGYEGAVVVLVVYVRETLGRGAGSYGIVLGAAGLGTAVATVALARRGAAAARAVPITLAALGPALLALMAFRPSFTGLMIVMVLLGASVSGEALYLSATIAERTPDEARGRTFGLSAAVLEMGDVAGALGVAALADRMSPAGAVAVGGCLAAALAVAALAPTLGRLRAEDAGRARLIAGESEHGDGQNGVAPGR